MRPRHLLLTALLVSACDKPAARTADAPSDSGAAAPAARMPAGISIDHERAADLTGDGRPERVVVRAYGTSYDSLQVHVGIVDSTGEALYTHTWPSTAYFKYSEAQRTPESDRAEVERQLARLVADSAFRTVRGTDARGRATDVDTDAIRHHLAEMARATRNDSTQASGRPPLTETDPAKVPAALVARVAAEVRTQPSFTYFAGGEETYTVRWSPSLKRFVRVFACC